MHRICIHKYRNLCAYTYICIFYTGKTQIYWIRIHRCLDNISNMRIYIYIYVNKPMTDVPRISNGYALSAIVSCIFWQQIPLYRYWAQFLESPVNLGSTCSAFELYMEIWMSVILPEVWRKIFLSQTLTVFCYGFYSRKVSVFKYWCHPRQIRFSLYNLRGRYWPSYLR